MRISDWSSDVCSSDLAVTSVDQLRGQTTAAPILANEQIPITRLAAGGGVNSLGITPGNVGLGLSIAGPQAVNGAITQGSSVVVYATFPKGTDRKSVG